MKIDIEVLRAALNHLLNHAKEMQGEFVDVDADLYWFVPKDMLNDPANKPSDLTMGSLEDDWLEISAIGTGTKEPFGYGLVWASTVLRAVGDITP
jgi:hypothetical protein